MLANLEGEDEMPPAPTPAPPIINVPPPVRLIGSRATAEIPPIASISVPSNAPAVGKGPTPSPGSPDVEPFESALGLGELASLTVSNEAEALSYEVSFKIVQDGDGTMYLCHVATSKGIPEKKVTVLSWD